MNALHHLLQKTKKLPHKLREWTTLKRYILNILLFQFIYFPIISRASTTTDSLTVKNLLNKAYSNWSTSTDSMLYYLREAEEQLTLVNYPKGKVRLYNLYGIYYWTKSEHFQALKNYNLAIEQAKVINNSYGIALGEINIAMVYLSLEEFDKSLIYFEKGIQHLPKTEKAKADEMEALNGIGIIYEKTNRFEKAIDYYQKGLDYALRKKDTILLAQQTSNIGFALYKLNKLEESRKYQETALRNYTLFKNTRGIIHTSLRLAEVLNKLNEFNKALVLTDSALHKALENDAKQLICEAYYLKAEIYYAQKNYNGSVNNLLKCNEFITYANPSTQVQILKKISEVFEILRKNDLALTYRKRYDVLKDSVSKKLTNQEIYKAEIDFEIRRKELENEKNLSNENAKKWYYYFILLLIVTIFITIGSIYAKLIKEKEIAQKTYEKLETEYKNIKLTNVKLNQEIEFKAKELANFTLNMVHRNNLLIEIKENLQALKSENNYDKNEKLQSIINFVHNNLNQEKDWITFKTYFENINSSFFDNLQKYYPELTSQEVKLCALIKLNLTIKETSSLLGISPDSVKVTRYRLKKKLKMTGNQSFNSLFNQLAEEQLSEN